MATSIAPTLRDLEDLDREIDGFRRDLAAAYTIGAAAIASDRLHTAALTRATMVAQLG